MHLADEHQEREEQAKIEEAEKAEKEQKEAEEAASANFDPTDATNPAQEAMDNEEPLDHGMVPPPSDSQMKPLKHMVKGMNFKPKEEDLMFPPANIGRPPTL